MNDREYREQEFKKIETVYCEHKPKMKIIKPNGGTNWLDITEDELTKIREILTK